MSVITCRKCGAEMVVSQPDRVHILVDRKVLNWKDLSNPPLNVKSVIFQIYCIGVNQKMPNDSKINNSNYQ